MSVVPNYTPSYSPKQRVAFVGEAPGVDEERAGEPFIGASGRLLRAIIHQTGIDPRYCFFGNVCQHRPPHNNIKAFSPTGPEITSGKQQLAKDINNFKPNIIVGLGNTALYYLHPNAPRGISAMRGTLFNSVLNHKTLCTFHPAAVLRKIDDLPFLRFDIARAINQAVSPDLVLPKRALVTQPSFEQAVEFLTSLKTTKVEVSLDIEGLLTTLA